MALWSIIAIVQYMMGSSIVGIYSLTIFSSSYFIRSLHFRVKHSRFLEMAPSLFPATCIASTLIRKLLSTVSSCSKAYEPTDKLFCSCVVCGHHGCAAWSSGLCWSFRGQCSLRGISIISGHSECETNLNLPSSGSSEIILP